MDGIKIGKGIRRVILLHKDTSGNVTPVELYRRKTKQKKGTTFVRPLEKVVRRAVNAQETGAKSYLSNHKRSNRKRRDGWVRDLPKNVGRSTRKGLKKIRISGLPLMP